MSKLNPLRANIVNLFIFIQTSVPPRHSSAAGGACSIITDGPVSSLTRTSHVEPAAPHRISYKAHHLGDPSTDPTNSDRVCTPLTAAPNQTAVTHDVKGYPPCRSVVQANSQCVT